MRQCEFKKKYNTLQMEDMKNHIYMVKEYMIHLLIF